MLTKSDMKWLKENLATKTDVKKLNKKFTQLFDFIDKDVMENKRKLKTIEQVLHISSVS